MPTLNSNEPIKVFHLQAGQLTFNGAISTLAIILIKARKALHVRVRILLIKKDIQTWAIYFEALKFIFRSDFRKQ